MIDDLHKDHELIRDAIIEVIGAEVDSMSHHSVYRTIRQTRKKLRWLTHHDYQRAIASLQLDGILAYDSLSLYNNIYSVLNRL